MHSYEDLKGHRSTRNAIYYRAGSAFLIIMLTIAVWYVGSHLELQKKEVSPDAWQYQAASVLSYKPEPAPAPKVSVADAPTVVFGILTHPLNYERRNKQRQVWLSKLPKGYIYKYIVGNPEKTQWTDKFTRDDFDAEMERYGDILIHYDYEEYYYTTFEKVVFGMKWGRGFYNPEVGHSQYYVKVDDDIYIDAPKMLDWFRSRPRDEVKLYWGHIFRNMEPSRDSRSKWVLTKEEFPLWVFPPFACGVFNVISMDLLTPVLNVIGRPRFRQFKFEDAQIGIIMAQLGIEPQDNNKVFQCWKHYVPDENTWFVHDFNGYL